jgi:hypothetical protein
MIPLSLNYLLLILFIQGNGDLVYVGGAPSLSGVTQIVVATLLLNSKGDH